VRNLRFIASLRAKVLSFTTGVTKIAVLQAANINLTKTLIRLLKDFGCEVHVISHIRFREEFTDVLFPENIHCFSNTADFKYDQLKEFARDLQEKHQFGGAIVPYSTTNGCGYEEVEKVVVEVGRRIVAGVTIEGTIIK